MLSFPEARPGVRDVQMTVNKPATSGDLAAWEGVRSSLVLRGVGTTGVDM